MWSCSEPLVLMHTCYHSDITSSHTLRTDDLGLSWHGGYLQIIQHRIFDEINISKPSKCSSILGIQLWNPHFLVVTGESESVDLLGPMPDLDATNSHWLLYVCLWFKMVTVQRMWGKLSLGSRQWEFCSGFCNIYQWFTNFDPSSLRGVGMLSYSNVGSGYTLLS